MKQVIRLSLTDFKLIFRDPSLRAFLFFPILLFILIIWLVPYLVGKYGFLEDYLSLFMVVAVVENTQMFSFITSMVLIDEKESDVAKTYGVVPISNLQFALSRLLIPFWFTVLLNVVLFVVQPFYDVAWVDNLAISVLTALIVPVYVLGLNSVAENRMQGMVYIKAFNMIVLLPIAAFFVPGSFKHFFGVLPTHWLFQSIDLMSQGHSILVFVAIGFLFSGLLLGWTFKTFSNRHFL